MRKWGERMNELRTRTYTQSFTKARIDVLSDHFELFLRCGGISESSIEKFLDAVERQELDAVGVYIEEGGYRVAEVEFEVNWETHNQMVHLNGKMFDTDLPGWNNGVSVEAYVAASRLTRLARAKGVEPRSWIRVSEKVRADKVKHRKVCDTLGYAYGSSVCPWKNMPLEQRRTIEGLEEGTITTRRAR